MDGSIVYHPNPALNKTGNLEKTMGQLIEAKVLSIKNSKLLIMVMDK